MAKQTGLDGGTWHWIRFMSDWGLGVHASQVMFRLGQVK